LAYKYAGKAQLNPIVRLIITNRYGFGFEDTFDSWNMNNQNTKELIKRSILKPPAAPFTKSDSINNGKFKPSN